MKKKDIENFCNREVFDKIEFSRCLDVYDIYTSVKYWFMQQPEHVKVYAKIINGALFINDSFVCRVALLPSKPGFSEEAYYWEGRILSRQETY